LVPIARLAPPIVGGKLKLIFGNLTTRPAPGAPRGPGFLAGLAPTRKAAQGVCDWLTWRTRIGVQYALLEATVGKLHNMTLRMQRSEGVGAIMTRLHRTRHHRNIFRGVASDTGYGATNNSVIAFPGYVGALFTAPRWCAASTAACFPRNQPKGYTC
jgi:hypothetical protein